MDKRMFLQEETAETTTERNHLAQKIQTHKDSVVTLKTRLDSLKLKRVQERLDQTTCQERRIFGAEAEASRISNLIDEHESLIRIFEREIRTMDSTDANIIIGIEKSNELELGTKDMATKLLKKIVDGQTVEINDHSLSYEDGIVWYTNPYGVDGCLGNEPSLKMMEIFLANMARDLVYGLTPE